MRPTIILVHGAYHSSSHFDKLASCLQRAGYEVEAVDLPSVGIEQDPGDALRRDTKAVLLAIEKLTNEGKNVVCGSEAAASFLTQRHQTPQTNHPHGTITRLIYLNADILPQNQSWLDTHPATKHPLIANLPVTLDKTSNMLTFLEPLKYFYTPTTSPLEAEIATSTLKPMATSAFAQKAEFDASRTWAAYRIPVSYVGCKQDGMLPWEMQQEYVAGLRAAGGSVSSTWLDYDHSPFVSHAEEVAQLIEVAIDKSE
ncbi:hypothetical protein D0869_13372 [Hortaea werneckii]|uniref:AB hydrolase-1 domain-containing protein n=1 Tax=Hortaea werneckii TaxID=91943 RepID=A0A3M6ZGB3_HORWE|nr:hypothetical protein KC324_g2166 [Hortaea werneckii]KAI7595203.1 hypothetical protein KC316_g670 [Hortaea werneckii]RMX73668.1 hypothetical protein D0869_13372 [Hortaea werneckii]RMY14253.1 hypothetical protein D0868_01567 [Hortaea werneckii]